MSGRQEPRPLYLILGALVLMGASVAGTLALSGRLKPTSEGGEAGHEEGGHEEEGHKEGGHAEAGHEEGGHEGHGHEEEGGHKEQSEGTVELSEDARKNAALEMREAGPGQVSSTVTLPGEITINADKLAHVTPRVSGTVFEVKGQLGQRVKKGDVLAVLQSSELSQISRDARAAAAHLKLAQANFDRLDELYKQGVVAQKEQLTAKTDLEEAKIAVDSAYQMLSAAGDGGGGANYPLKAPIDGTILEKHITLGEVLKGDSEAFVIADLSSVWVELTVYAKDLARVDIGQAVSVRADGIDAPAAGTIEFLGSVASTVSRSSRARVVLTDPGPKWRPGLFVSADVAVTTAVADIVVPAEAVQTVDGKSVLFVDEGEHFEARVVTTKRAGLATDGTPVVTIEHGLAKGEWYVAKNAFVLKAELGKGSAKHDH